MNLSQFKDWAVAQGSVANPTSSPDHQYLGQCVSLIQQYLSRVYGVPWAARGHAKDWVNNPVSDKFDKVSGPPQSGDIVVYDGRFGGGYGHIAISLGGNQMLDQNGAGNGKIRVGTLWPNYSAVLRPKGSQGGNVGLTAEQSAKIRQDQLRDIGKEVSVYNGDEHVDQIIANIRTLQNWYGQREAVQKQVADLINLNEDRLRLIEKLEAGSGVDTQQLKDQLKESNDKLNQIKEIVQ